MIDESTVASVIKDLLRGDSLRQELDATFRRLELRHPALSELIAGEVAEIDSATGQALGYFLFLTVYRAFEQRFGTSPSQYRERFRPALNRRSKRVPV